jgi:hypothetical protein
LNTKKKSEFRISIANDKKKLSMAKIVSFNLVLFLCLNHLTSGVYMHKKTTSTTTPKITSTTPSATSTSKPPAQNINPLVNNKRNSISNTFESGKLKSIFFVFNKGILEKKRLRFKH